MRNVGNITISNGAQITTRSASSSIGFSGTTLIRGPGTKLVVNDSSVFGGYSDFVIENGAEIIVDGGLLIAGGIDNYRTKIRDSSLHFRRTLLVLNDAFITSSTIYMSGLNEVVSIVALRPVLLFDRNVVDVVDDAEFRLQRPNTTDNSTQTITRSTIRLFTGSRFSADTLMELKISTTLTILGGELAATAGVRVCNNSFIYVSGADSELRVQDAGVQVCDNSQIVIENGAILRMADAENIYAIDFAAIIDGESIDKINRTGTSENSDIRTDSTSLVRLSSGGRLLAVGIIDGTVINEGGLVTYRNGSKSAIIYVDQFTQSGNGTLETSLVFSNATNNVTSSTNIATNNATVGGVVRVNVPDTLDQSLRSNSSVLVLNMEPGTGGILLLNSSTALTLDSPRLQVATESGAAPACGYSLEQRGKSLFLVFDTSITGCSTPSDGATNAPDGTPIQPRTDNGLTAADAAFPGWAIGIIVAAVILIVIGIILVVAFVPKIRRSLFAMEAAEYEMSIRVKSGVGQTEGPPEVKPVEPAQTQWRKATY